MNGRRGGAPKARITSPSASLTFPASVPGAPAAVRAPAPAAISPAALKSARQRAIRELIARSAIGSQQDLVEALRARGMDVTQATVSRDVTELGLVKITRGERHIYVSAADLAAGGAPTSDALLRRLLADIPVRVGRSGLTLVLTSAPGTASSIAQAIDQSTLTDQEGTLAGDNTLLVLFADEARLEHWLNRFRELEPVRERAAPDQDAAAPTEPTPSPGLQEVSR